jgi:predicted DNA-binding antitoxin AbrB/MazE fold protein
VAIALAIFCSTAVLDCVSFGTGELNMHEQIKVVYEKGVLRPLVPIPDNIQEHQHLTVTIERLAPSWGSDQDADPTVSLETVRQLLAKVPGTLAQAALAERDER